MENDNKLRPILNATESFIIPIVMIGGIFLGISLATGELTYSGIKITSLFMGNLYLLGTAGFAIAIPLLSGFIASKMAGNIALVPGVILGYIANNPIGENQVRTGFLGAMFMGITVGYLFNLFKSLKLSNRIFSIVYELIISIIITFILGMVYIYIIAVPVGLILEYGLNDKLINYAKEGEKIKLGFTVGAMTVADMGGIFNKTATNFTTLLMYKGIYEPNGAQRIASTIPPLVMSIFVLIDRKNNTAEDKIFGVSVFFMGLMGITEGVIPFIVRDIKRVLPSLVIGSATGGAIGMIKGVEVLIPNGGLIVLPVVNEGLWYCISILIGTLVSLMILCFTKKNRLVYKSTEV